MLIIATILFLGFPVGAEPIVELAPAQTVEVVAQAPSSGLMALLLSFLVMGLGQLLKSPLLREWLTRFQPHNRTYIMALLGLAAGGAGGWMDGQRGDDLVRLMLESAAGTIAMHEVFVAGLMRRKTGSAVLASPDAGKDQ